MGCSPRSGCAPSVPALRAAAPNLPLEVHSHMTATMGAACYARGRRAGCLVPLHRGEAARERNVAAFGGADDREPARARVSRRPRRRRARARCPRYFTEPRRPSSDRPVGVAARVRRLPSTSTSCPGGMTSTLRRQLAEIGMEHRWHDVLDELPRVARRARLADHGHAAVAVRRRPGVPQRHRAESAGQRLPDEVIRYVLGPVRPARG